MMDAVRASRLLNRPLALLPSEAALLLDALQGHPQAQLVPPEQAAARERTYGVTAGIAVIPVQGCLSHGAGWSWWGETSYDSIRRCFADALANPEVVAIALHVNSPGGDVAGMLDLADAIYAARGTKPIWAILDENAFSAAYALACCCDKVTVPRTGGTGSIGTILLHADITGMLDEIGIKVTAIKYGAYKDDGAPTTPMAGDVLARVQGMVDTLGEMFTDQVARNRGMKVAAVRAMEAGIFLGADGVKAGLADEVMSPDEAFLALLKTLS